MSTINMGELAPAFSAATYTGEELTLDSYKGAKVWLAFFRFASCPLCNYRIHELMERYDDISAGGIRVVGVMQSKPEQIAQYAQKRKAPFPIIADPKRKLYKLYGVNPSWLGMLRWRVWSTMFKAMFKGILPGIPGLPLGTVPADFLIDPEGMVWHSYYGKAVSDHVSFDKVMEFAADDCLDIARPPQPAS